MHTLHHCGYIKINILMGGDQMPDVNCTVDTCQYWQNSNLCKAKQIVIQSDEAGGFSPNAKLEQLSATPATTIDETCCQTFKNAKG